MLTEKQRLQQLDDSLAKKFDGKPVPKIVTGESIRKDYYSGAQPVAPDNGVSTTVNELIDELQCLRGCASSLKNAENSLSFGLADKSEEAQGLLTGICDQIKTMIGEINQLMKDKLGAEATSEE